MKLFCRPLGASLLTFLVAFVFTFWSPRIFAETLIWNAPDGFQSSSHCHQHEVDPFNSETFSSYFASDLSSYLNRVFEITGAMASAPPSPFSLVGSFWQVRTTPRGISILSCINPPGRNSNYVIFEVHRPEVESLVAEVGLPLDAGASIFKYVRVHTIPEADLAFASRVASPETHSPKPSLQSIEGRMEFVLCTGAANDMIYDESLSQVLAEAQNGDPIRIVQSFEPDEVETVVQGRLQSFTRVQLVRDREAPLVGFVSSQIIKLKSECHGEMIIESILGAIGAWRFPTESRPTSSYLTGMRRFKADRDGGARYHAACDLYRNKDDKVLAAANGQVLRDRYYFYQGTYAIEVKHSDGKVVRYGEITGTAAPGVSPGRSIASGQTIGYVGKVNSNCCEPMLHFEMYSGTGSGALTQSGNKFNRRSDLIDPTAFLRDWEKSKFGKSY